MRRSTTAAAPAPAPDLDLQRLEPLVSGGRRSPGIDERVAAALAMCNGSAESIERLTRFLIETGVQRYDALLQTESSIAELQRIADGLLAPPWYPAVFLRRVDAAANGPVLVWQGGTFRVVHVADGVDLNRLSRGDEVYMGHEMNVVVAHSPGLLPRCGETASFERLEADGRIVVRARDEEILIDAAATLPVEELNHGDLLRWQRETWMAFERLQRSAGRRYLLDEVPEIDRSAIGGQEHIVDEVLCALTATLIEPETAARYRYGVRQSILLYGPPGCGKTLIARIAASELSRLSGRKCLFGVVKPSEWEAPHVGETQQNIRNCFQSLREEADGAVAVLFLDEVETAGRLRGSVVGHHSDKFLAALLAELDGFSARSGIAVIAASNRKDLIDPALLERLSDLELRVERPGLDAARAIFSIHLPEELPYHRNGTAPAETRKQIIETALSRLYGPNADNEICRLRFRDGATRSVAVRELISGRTLEQLCRTACRRALWRDIKGGDAGICVGDIEEACADAVDRLATNLSLHNVGAYLDDLPQDLDVVAVEATPRRPPRPHRYLQAGEETRW